MDYTELLPPLPELALFDGVKLNDNHKYVGTDDGYTADQVRAYALSAIAAAAPAIRRAERERCAALVERKSAWTGGHGYPPQPSGDELAAAIRALPEQDD